MDNSSILGVGLLAVWGLIKVWPQVKDGVTKALPLKSQDEAVNALEAAQTLHAFLSKRPGCKKSLEALGTLTLGNFLPAPQPAPTTASAEGGEQKVLMDVRHYNMQIPAGKSPIDVAVGVVAPSAAATAPVVVPVPSAPQAPAGQS